MDINENLLQTNTFVGGMNTDTSDSLIDSKQYRFAKNVRVTTNTDENSGELHLIEGTTLEHSLNIGEIIASTNIREYGIIIARNNNTWSIYKFTKTNTEPKRIFGPCTEPIWDDDNTKPSLLTRYESEKNIKLYIADGIHLLMYINIALDNDTIDTSIENLQGHVNTALDPLEVTVSDFAGILKPAKVQYCYRLYSEYGAVTRISPLSKVLSLYKDSNNGYSNTERSGRAVDILLPELKYTDLDRIQLFRINYVENGQVPEVYMIKDLRYPSNRKIIDTGNSDIQQIAISELLSYLQLGIIPSTIESKSDYLFAANVKYVLTDVDKLFENVDVRSFSSGMYVLHGDTKVYLLESKYTPEKNEIIYHDAFDQKNEYIEWNKDHWKNKYGSYGGSGAYFDWSYYSTSHKIDLLNQSSGYKEQISSLKPGEVYRFGVILYDLEGNASSVKWIADILNYSSDTGYSNISVNDTDIKEMNETKSYNPSYQISEYSISFRLNKEIPNCSKYEIVRCNRTMNDRLTIVDGIIGHPVRLYNIEKEEEISTDKICSSGFISLDHVIMDNSTSTWDPNYNKTKIAYPERSVVQFVSPEYCYQEDDIKEIIDINKNNIKLNVLCHFMSPSLQSRNRESQPNNYVKIISNSQTNTERGNFFYVKQAESNNYYCYRNGDLSITIPNHETKKSIIKYNYIQPYFKSFSSFSKTSYEINNIAYPKIPDYNTFSENENIRFKDDVTNLGNFLYISWTNPLILEEDTGTESPFAKALKDGFIADVPVTRSNYPIGIAGKCILINTKEEFPIKYGPLNAYYNTLIGGSEAGGGMFDITYANIRKKAIPYGGYNKESIENSTYYSFGNVFENKESSNVFKGGDCYPLMFTYLASSIYEDYIYTKGSKQCTIYNIPIYSDIDLRGRFGYEFDPTGNNPYLLQNKACSFEGVPQDKDFYLYNTAYNAYPDVIGFTSEEQTQLKQKDYDTRIHYSEQKTNGELIDNWLLFRAMNFLDVDSRYGDITGLRLFKDKLIFWLKDATGLLSVNERILLKDTDDAQVTLGTGAVLERYDYFTTQYGMKPNIYVDTLSDASLYWWDGYRKEILQYTDKYSVTPLTTTKLIRNYINENRETTIPTTFYDTDNKEVVFSCVENGSVIYSEQIQLFSSIYEFMPISAIKLSNSIYTFDNKNMYLYNSCINNKATLFGNPIYPYIKYIINKNSALNKTYDIQTFGGRLYGGDRTEEKDDLESIQMVFKTPLKQEGRIIGGRGITNREYDFRLNIPRAGIQSTTGWIVSDFGDRLRGKTMQCELFTNDNSTDFSLQYITTKYRISWS